MRSATRGMAAVLAVLSVLLLPGQVGAQEKRVTLPMGSFHTGTGTYIYAGMLAGFARRALPEVSISNEATGGSSENLDLMRRGELVLGCASAERIYAAYKGIDRYKDKSVPVSILWSFSQQPAHMFVRADSAIKSFRDLKGKKITLGPAGSASEIKNSYIVEAYGYTRQARGKFDFVEFQTVKLSYPEAANALAEGVVDAIVITQAAPEPALFELGMRIPMRVIPVEQEMFDKVKKIYPFVWPLRIPAKSYPGQDQELSTLGDDTYVIAHQSALSEEAGYKLTKAYVEKILPEMAQQLAPLKIFVQNPATLVEYTVVPVHAGALKYYRERGITPKMIAQ